MRLHILAVALGAGVSAAHAAYLQAERFQLRSLDHDAVLLSDDVHSMRRVLGERDEDVFNTPLDLHLSFTHKGEDFEALLERRMGAIQPGAEITIAHEDGSFETKPAPEVFSYRNKQGDFVLTFHSHEKFDGLFVDHAGARILHFTLDQGFMQVNDEVHNFYDGAFYEFPQMVDVNGRKLDGVASERRAITYWDNCYPGQQDGTRNFIIGFAVGSKLFNTLGESGSVALVNSVAELSNDIYVNQMSVRLTVGRVFLEKGGANAAEFDNPNCANDISVQLNQLQNWQGRPVEQGTWHLLDNCFGFSGSTLGIAKIGVLCRSRVNVGVSYYTDTGGSLQRDYPTWATVAHEVGHNFGAQHSFENGQGTTGGIMDYGPLRNRLIDGVMQFNTPLRKKEVCAEISSVVNCQFFQKPSTPAPTPRPTLEPTPNPTPKPTEAQATPQPTEFPTPNPTSTSAPTTGLSTCQKFTEQVFIGDADILLGTYADWTVESCYDKCQNTQGCKSFVTSVNRRYCELWSDAKTSADLEAFQQSGFDTYICPFVSDGDPTTNDGPQQLVCTVHRNAVIPGVANVYSGSYDPFWTLDECSKACVQNKQCRAFTFSALNQYCELWDERSPDDLMTYANFDTYLCSSPEQFVAEEESQKSIDDLLGTANVVKLVQSCCTRTADKYYLGMNKMYLENIPEAQCQDLCVGDTTCHSYTFDEEHGSCEFWTAKAENETQVAPGLVTTDCNRICIAKAVRPDIAPPSKNIIVYVAAGAAVGFVALVGLVVFVSNRRSIRRAAARRAATADDVKLAVRVSARKSAVPVAVDVYEEDSTPMPAHASASVRGAAHYTSGAPGGYGGYSSAPPGYRA